MRSWGSGGGRYVPDPRRVAEFADFARRLERERQDALVQVDRILKETARNELPSLVERTELRTAGALDRLSGILSKELTRNPQYAEALAVLAVSIAEALPAVYPPVIVRQSRAHAWNDVGKVRSFLARHDEAIGAFARAEVLAEEGGLAHDHAIVRLNLSLTYQETGRYEEARTLLAECKEVFREHGDDSRFVLTSFYEGVLLQRLRRFREAREAFLILIASTHVIPKSTLAALHQSIGLCSIELREFEVAEGNLGKAIVLHRELGETLAVTNAEYGRGRLLLRRGLFREGVQHLQPVRHQYLKHSMTEEAGLCGLEMVEGCLALEEVDQAGRLARTVMSEFLAANLSGRAITALGYLTEAITAHTAAPKHVSHVREYIVSLRTTPEREFAQLQLPPRGGE
jgi:tetratricopeptide (TPR) repeat protein